MLCSKLESTHRWVVSGTPLCSRVEDLHGELNFLRDGFWSHNIGVPYIQHEESALLLLHRLLDVVMMRHSKSQKTVAVVDESTGSILRPSQHIVKIPGRTIEWRPVQLTDTTEVYIHHYLQHFAATALTRFIDSLISNRTITAPAATHSNHPSQSRYTAPTTSTAAVEDINRITLSPEVLSRLPNFHQIMSLHSLISRSLTHPSLVPLVTLDHLRRMLLSTYTANNSDNQKDPHNSGNRGYTIRLLPADEVLTITQSMGQGVG